MNRDETGFGGEDQPRTVERSAMPFDHANHDVKIQFLGPSGEEFGFLTATRDRGIGIAEKEIPSFAGTVANRGPEAQGFGISPEKGFGEDNQTRIVCCRLTAETLHTPKSGGGVEEDRSNLRDGYFHDANSIANVQIENDP
jgi:hypothetical protein